MVGFCFFLRSHATHPLLQRLLRRLLPVFFDLEKTIDAQINESPVALSVIMGNKVSPDFDQLILSCLEKNMAERPASARDLYEALERCQPSQDWTRTRAEEWWKEQDKRRSALPSDENSLESSMRTLSIDLMSPRTQKLLDRST